MSHHLYNADHIFEVLPYRNEVNVLVRDTKLFEWALSSYWDYYRELEDELLHTRRYVSFSKDNFPTFSIEYLKLLEAACSEVDVLLKVIAKVFNEEFDSNNTYILKSWYEIQNRAVFPGRPRRKAADSNPIGTPLEAASCTLTNTIKLEPWKDFRVEQYQDKQDRTRYRCENGKQPPKWWSAYNKVKHERAAINPNMLNENYALANLGNVVQAFAGLYMLEHVLLCSLGTEDDIEGFCDDSVLFTGRAKLITSGDIDSFFDEISVSSPKH